MIARARMPIRSIWHAEARFASPRPGRPEAPKGRGYTRRVGMARAGKALRRGGARPAAPLLAALLVAAAAVGGTYLLVGGGSSSPTSSAPAEKPLSGQALAL